MFICLFQWWYFSFILTDFRYFSLIKKNLKIARHSQNSLKWTLWKGCRWFQLFFIDFQLFLTDFSYLKTKTPKVAWHSQNWSKMYLLEGVCMVSTIFHWFFKWGYTVLPLSSVRPSKIFFVAFFSVTIDSRNLIFGHKRHIGIPYCG